MLNKNAFKVGLFVVITTFLVVMTIGFMVYKKGVFEKVYTYTLSSKSGENLTLGMPVVFSGFTIGKVDVLELNEEGVVLITIKVPKRHIKWIRSNSVFSLDKPLIGAPKITVITENLNSPPLSPEAIVEIGTANDINEIIKRVNPILEMVNRIAANIETISVNLANPRGDVNKILRNAEKLTSNLSGKPSLLDMAVDDRESINALYSAMKSTKVITSQIEDTLKKVDAMAVKTDEKVYGREGSLSLVNNILKDLIIKLQNLDATLANVNTISKDAADSTKDFKLLREEIDGTIYSIKELVKKVDDLVPFKKEPDIKLP
ncbi:MAG: MCE family protein [Deltaproteobacteria bacterium]|nr:MCE family protein [Deltaproteobacteria bacterium]